MGKKMGQNLARVLAQVQNGQVPVMSGEGTPVIWGRWPWCLGKAFPKLSRHLPQTLRKKSPKHPEKNPLICTGAAKIS